MKVLITGANGFIGSHITRAFHKSKSWEIGAMVRPDANLRFLSNYSVDILKAELPDSLPPSDVLAQYDRVVHVAGKVSDWGNYQDFFRANVLGALRLFDALPEKTGFIYISSNAVMGEEDNLKVKNERAPYRPVLDYAFESLLPSAMNHYRLSKALAEMLLTRRARKLGRRLTIVRPVWVYGPREFHAGPYEYCQTVASGLPVMPGSSKNRFHVIYVEDLARIVMAIATKMKKGVNIYNVGQPDVPLMSDYWGAFCKAMNCRQPTNIPKALLYPPAFAMELLWSWLGIKTPPLFTRARVYMFYANNMYDVTKITRDYPITEFTPLSTGTRRTVRWWRMNGHL